MASTSKYIQIDPQILLEYIYTDPVSPEVISTTTSGNRLMLLDNVYTDSNVLFNEDNPQVNTGNFRYKSAIPIDSERRRYAFLTNRNVLNYLDFDENLSTLNDLFSQLTGPINTPPRNVQYDTIRLHLVSGFSFENKGDGFIFEVLLRDRKAVNHNLASIVYRSSDSYEISNPSPFISNEKLFTKYIEIKVIALNYLVDDYIINKSNPNAISNLLTSGIGLTVHNTIGLSLKFINRTEVINGQTFFNLGEGREVSINKVDEYSGLNAVIQESSSGDFFELYGQFNGDIYEDFIINLNNLPNTDLIVVHDIILFEQIGTSFTKTSEQSFIQSDGFDTPYRFRPIILNSHIATSYRISYTLRILNKIDNSQIIRTSQLASFDVKKYGRRIRKLNLGTVPTVTKVYNKISGEIDNITLNNSSKFNFNSTGSSTSVQTEFVMGFKESINVSASIGTVKTTPSVLEEGDIVPTIEGEVIGVGEGALEISDISGSNKIFGQSEGYINITPFDNFIKFVFYDNSETKATRNSTQELLDLTNVGTLYITFTDNESGDEIRIENYRNIKGLSPAQGEVVFRISKDQSKKILKFNNSIFYISSALRINSERSDETMLYTGNWFNANEKPKIILSERVKELEEKLLESNNELALEKEASDNIIRKLEKETSVLQKEKKLLENKMSELDQDINNIIKEVRQQEKDSVEEKNDKKSQLKGSIKLVKDRIDKGLGKFVSPLKFEGTSGLSAKTFKLNK